MSYSQQEADLITELESLRAQVETLLTEKKQDAENMLRLIMDMRYVAGIAQRGRGKPLEHGEKFAQAVLDYVKSLEEQNALLTLQVQSRDGWKLVPIEPTKKMLEAASAHYVTNEYTGVGSMYKSMLAAISQQPMHTEREE